MSKELESLEKRLSEAKTYGKEHTNGGVAFALGYLIGAVENYISEMKGGGGNDQHEPFQK